MFKSHTLFSFITSESSLLVQLENDRLMFQDSRDPPLMSTPVEKAPTHLQVPDSLTMLWTNGSTPKTGTGPIFSRSGAKESIKRETCDEQERVHPNLNLVGKRLKVQEQL